MELVKIMATESPEDVVSKVCGLTTSEKLYPKMVNVVRRVQADLAED